MQRLLEESNEAYYWIGFLLADGSFGKTERLSLKLASKDDDHVRKFAKFVGRPVKEDSRGLDVYKKFEEDRLICLIVGFIDGDGCIMKQSNGRKDAFLRVKVHSFWLSFLNYMRETVINLTGVESPKAKINNFGYAELNICNQIPLRKLRDFVFEKKLPALIRKWVEIEDYELRGDKANRIAAEIQKLRKGKMKYKDIAIVMNMPKGSLAHYAKKELPV